MFKQPLTADEIRAIAARSSVSDIFSWKSPTARKAGITPGSRTDEELIALMAAEPRLIRRPLIITDDELIIGGDPKRLAQFVG